MKIGVILGSIREGRLGEEAARWVIESASGRGGFEYELLDLAEFNVPALVSATVPAMANRQYEDEAVNTWSKAVDSCDGFVFVTPEYNHSVPGTFKNAFDSLSSEWTGKPVGFVGYGSAGALRAVEHWRQIISNFSMPNVRNQVALSMFEDYADGAIAPRASKAAELDRMLGDLEALLA
ncbi:NADPH-dependent FMN reductase [Corynebacterium sp. UBA2622]|uniref:NADPH-dependent FMN reductase n=1 Tax=Corynebacterium sp. UBA2622 TaxID=1946393 RepID=UPI0025C2EF20|nr:NAD(P)H-dependent oxidoreductase [Corynebacterium sp. UBA2622]